MDSVSQVIVRLVDALESSGTPYALGGALALAAWSEPRATADVDLILWVGDDALPAAFDVLAGAGVEFDRTIALTEVAEAGMFVGFMGKVRVDVFLPSIPFYSEALLRRARTSIAGRSTWVHSAEVLAVFKLLFFRPKDLIDIERMLEVQGARFDRDFVRKAIVDMLGDDPRVGAWDAMCKRVQLA